MSFPSPPIEIRVKVFRRDHWHCRHCGRAVVFDWALKAIEAYLNANTGQHKSVDRGYYDLHWSQERAPLLCDLAAVSARRNLANSGDEVANFVTICNHCNRNRTEFNDNTFQDELTRTPIAISTWDGLSAVFLQLFTNMEPSNTADEWRKQLLA